MKKRTSAIINDSLIRRLSYFELSIAYTVHIHLVRLHKYYVLKVGSTFPPPTSYTTITTVPHSPQLLYTVIAVV